MITLVYSLDMLLKEVKEVSYRMKKKIMALMLTALLILNIVPIPVTAQEQDIFLLARKQAVRWLEEQKEEEGCFGDDRLINDTCDALTVLPETEDSYNEFLEYWYEEEYCMNHDMLARYSIATKDQWLISSFPEVQNSDGGFGLNEEYESDVWDSILILEAYIQEYCDEITESADKLIQYLCCVQNEDGGWSYNELSGSDTMLTARAGYDILEYLSVSKAASEDIEELLKLTDEFLLEQSSLSLDKNHFQEYGYYYLYLNARGRQDVKMSSEQEFLAIQKEDGSFFDCISDTVLAIRLLDKMEEQNRLVLDIKSMGTELSSYVIDTNEASEITLNGSVSYIVNKNKVLNMRMFVLDGTDIIAQREGKVTLTSLNTEVKLEPYSFTLNEEVEKEITVLTQLYEEDTILAKDSCTVKVKQPQSLEDLKLKADVTTGKNYQIELSWNDISTQEQIFGYHTLRRMEGSQWETRSSWDGEEKVKVLNVYPHGRVSNSLKEWMEQTVDNTEKPAGKGMFVIDTVHIADYNLEPEKYLYALDGKQYKYDVIFFGSYDGNADWDISESAFEETEKFVESGHGVLFGHDTIINISSNNHVQFCKFANKLGIIPTSYLKSNTSINYTNTKIDVVKDGFLTNYPWKLQGTLDVAGTHNYEEYAGGALGSEVWMELQSGYDVDESTGAKNNSYLFTNNQLAMIQTGHSAGQATDDERKILANTLFYLKQFTEKTSAEDRSFYDEAKPDAPDIVMLEQNQKDNQYELTTNIKSEDSGTDYEYYVEGLQKNPTQKSENIGSNVVNAQALSGIRGYLIGINESPEPMKELIYYEEDGVTIANVLPAKDGMLQYHTDSLQGGHTYYMHVYAIDWANNVSEETVQQFSLEKKKEKTGFHSTLELDKTEVKNEESLVCHIAASCTKGEGTAKGILELLDEHGEKVENLASELEVNLEDDSIWTKDVSWVNKELMAGTYYIQLSWYQDSEILEQKAVSFTLLKNGSITNSVMVNQQEVQQDSAIQVSDRIKNTSTNGLENDLNVTFTVYDSNQNVVLCDSKYIAQLLMEDTKDVKAEFDLRGLEAGQYVIESAVSKNSEIISESTTALVIQPYVITHSFLGELTVEETAGTQQFQYAISNKGDTVQDLNVRLSIVSVVSGNKVKETLSIDDFLEGATKNYKQVQITSDLDTGDYLAILTVADFEGEKVLDAVSFRVEREAYPIAEGGPMLVATEKSITLQCAEVELSGDVYASEDFKFGGSILNMDGMCSAGNKVEANGWKIQIAEREEQASQPPMPDYTYFIPTGQRSLADFNNMTVAIDSNFIQDDSFTINADDVQIGTGVPVIIASLNGDITVNASKMNSNGLIYAPNGTVYLNISQIGEIKGRIIASEICIQGTEIHIGE